MKRASPEPAKRAAEKLIAAKPTRVSPAGFALESTNRREVGYVVRRRVGKAPHPAGKR